MFGCYVVNHMHVAHLCRATLVHALVLQGLTQPSQPTLRQQEALGHTAHDGRETRGN